MAQASPTKLKCAAFAPALSFIKSLRPSAPTKCYIMFSNGWFSPKNQRPKSHMKTTYTVDRHNRITGVGGSWNEFATQDDGARATDEQISGHSLWNFIHGFEV